MLPTLWATKKEIPLQIFHLLEVPRNDIVQLERLVARHSLGRSSQEAWRHPAPQIRLVLMRPQKDLLVLLTMGTRGRER